MVEITLDVSEQTAQQIYGAINNRVVELGEYEGGWKDEMVEELRDARTQVYNQMNE